MQNMDCSISSRSSLSDIRSLDEALSSSSQSSKKAKRDQVLNTMMRILSSLSTVNSKQIEKSYKMAVEDKRHKLPDNQKYYLFQQLAKFKSIIKIVFLQEDQSNVQKSPIALVKNHEDELFLSRWSVDPEDRKDLEILSTLMSQEKVKSTCVIYLESEDVRKYESQRSLNTSIELSKSVYNENKTQFSQERLTQSAKPQIVNYASFVGNTQSSSSTLKGFNPNSGTGSFSMNHQNQPISQRDNKREEDIQKVLQQFGETRLHSEKLLQDYGQITYRELFARLISDPDNETNNKWIRRFREPFSDSWKHHCFQALKFYFRKYQ